MQKLRRLTPELCVEYQAELLNLFYANVKTCKFTDQFSKKEAEEKISQLKLYLEQDAAISYGYFCEDVLVGFIWAYRHTFREEPRVYVSVVQVLESWRGRGIGGELLRAVEADARHIGVPALYIHTEAENEGAIRLYKKEGYIQERVQLRKQLL